MQLTKDFNLIEFACHDGSPVPASMMANVKELAANLQVLRDEVGSPIYINSAYRSPAHNAKIGGEKNSYHMRAMAADITCKKYTPAQLRTIILKLIKEGRMKQGGLGAYKTFTHYDVRGIAARWKG